MSKYGVISGPYLPVFSPNTGKYGPKISPYLDTFQWTVFYVRTNPSYPLFWMYNLSSKHDKEFF